MPKKLFIKETVMIRTFSSAWPPSGSASACSSSLAGVKSTTPECDPNPSAERWIVMRAVTSIDPAHSNSANHTKPKEYIMSIIKNRKKSVTAALGAAAAAVAAPAMLFLGAGSAQATTVSANPHFLGVTVHIEDDLGNRHGNCTYSAVPVPQPGKLTPLSVTNVPFVLQKNNSFDLQFPGIQTGHHWDTTVWCSTGGAVHKPADY